MMLIPVFGRGGIVGHAVIDDEDADLIVSRRWNLHPGGYAQTRDSRTTGARMRFMHRMILDEPPRPLHIDHINGDPLDNRRPNLRVVTSQINQVNRRMDHRNTSGVRGVVRFGEKWKAQITAAGRNYHLGCFSTLEEAAEARRLAEIEHYGEACQFARIRISEGLPEVSS